MYFPDMHDNPLKADSSLYNNTGIIVVFVRKKYNINKIKLVLESYGYSYEKDEIEEFIGGSFFKKRMDDYLREMSAEGEIKENYLVHLKQQCKNMISVCTKHQHCM